MVKVKEELNQLFQKYVEGIITEEELNRFFTHMRDPKNLSTSQKFIKELDDYIKTSESVDDSSPDFEKLRNQIRKLEEFYDADFGFEIEHPEDISVASIELEIELPENISDKKAIAIIKAVALLADNYHRSQGGSGLEVNDIEIEETIFELEPLTDA